MLPNSGYNYYNYSGNYSSAYSQHVVQNPQVLPPGGVFPGPSASVTIISGLPGGVFYPGNYSGAYMQNVFNQQILPPGGLIPGPSESFTTISGLPGGVTYHGNYFGGYLQNVNNPQIFHGQRGVPPSTFLPVNSSNMYRQSYPPNILPRPTTIENKIREFEITPHPFARSKNSDNVNNLENSGAENMPLVVSANKKKENNAKKNGRQFIPRKVDVHKFDSQGLASEGYNFGSKNQKKTT